MTVRKKLVLGVCFFIVGCSVPKKPASLPDPVRLESELVIGVATESEVIELMGQPNGRGATLLPPEHNLQTILYYDYIEIGEIHSTGFRDLEANVHQRVIGIMLRDGIYDGFMWFSTEATAVGKGDAGATIIQ
jgi:hypothetical protein